MLGSASLGSAALGASSTQIVAGTGLAAGSSTASAVGVAVNLPAGSGVGQAAGSSSALGVGARIVCGVGLAAGSSSAFSLGVTAGTGRAAGTSRAIGISRTPPSRILSGRLPSGGRGLRISEPAYNASADPVDDTRLYFSTEWPDVMPIHQIGSAIMNPSLITQSVVTQLIDFPTLGYIPFVEFYVQSNADALPAGSSIYPSNQWYHYGSMALLYFQSPANAYLRLNISATQLRLESYTRNVSSNTFGAARSYVIYWVIYRRRAL